MKGTAASTTGPQSLLTLLVPEVGEFYIDLVVLVVNLGGKTPEKPRKFSI